MRATGDEASTVCQEEGTAERLDPPRDVGDISKGGGCAAVKTVGRKEGGVSYRNLSVTKRKENV